MNELASRLALALLFVTMALLQTVVFLVSGKEKTLQAMSTFVLSFKS